MNTDQVPSEKDEQQKCAPEEGIKQENFSASLISFKELFEKQENFEERLRIAIEFMRKSLSQEGTPRFKDFWEAKKMCLPLFKEKINPILKAQLWTEYAELSSEAKRLKDMLEEQSTFAIEQIELALKALEDDLAQESALVEKLPSIEISREISLSRERRYFYDQKQREVQFYVTMTARLKDLRKGVIETEMRIRHKNRLLKRLSSIGDLFLPKKKFLIKAMSEEFVKDVKVFAETYFDKEQQQIKLDVHLYKLREEIKGFQDAAKKISLNSHAFSQTRLLLSECWEIVKQADKEKKKEFLDKKQLFKENYDKALERIDTFAKDIKEKPFSTKEELQTSSRELMNEIEKDSLLHNDVKILKIKLREIQQEALKPFIEQEQIHLAKRQEKETSRQEQLELFKQTLQTMVRDVSSQTLKSLTEMYASFDEKKKALKPSERESHKLAEAKRELYEGILLKREEEVQSEDKEALQELLQDWEAFKEQARMHVETYRRGMGSSGFDFEKAMLFREQMDLEKARLDRATQKVTELEDKLI